MSCVVVLRVGVVCTHEDDDVDDTLRSRRRHTHVVVFAVDIVVCVDDGTLRRDVVVCGRQTRRQRHTYTP
jgi:hypothetical protein